MKMLSKPIKTKIIFGIIVGFIFALTQAAFDYFNAESFSILKFLFNFLFLGVLMGIFIKPKIKKN